MTAIIVNEKKDVLKNIYSKECPSIGDRVIIKDISYIVLSRTYDLDEDCVYIHVSPMMGEATNG
jgi:hypothetical protein